jgi:ankyrin repeat protein
MEAPALPLQGSHASGGSGNDGLDALRALRAYVGLSDSAGLTALHLAGQWGMAEVVRDLILGPQAPQGAPIEANGKLPQEGQPGAARCSLEQPQARALAYLADPNCRSADEEGLTPAHLAARWGHAGVLSTLRTLGADLQLASSGKRRTPLQEAQEWSRPGCIEFLAGL